MGSSSSSKEEVVSTPREYNWHAKTSEEVLEALGVTAEGLSEQTVAERRQQNGANTFSTKQSKTFLEQLFGQLKSPLTIVLIIACGLTLVLGEYIDTTVIAFALLIAVSVGLIQEGRASRAFQRLSESQVHTAIVIREGKRHEVTADAIVPGDIVLLQSGMQVPADIRLISAKTLSVNEAALTGEWLAVDKTIESVAIGAPLADRESMAWKGTFVAEGHAEGVVVATGDNTEVGKLASDLADIEDEVTPLQHEMQRVSRIMFIIVLALVSTIFMLGILRGEPIEGMLIMAIAIAVAAIPEGLPAAVTIILAVGMEALLKRGGLVRNLLAAETLGSTTFVLTDKTGTLTEGRMAVVQTVLADGDYAREQWNDMPRMYDLFNTALCATDAFIDERLDDETYTLKGEPMERAILEGAMDVGVAAEGKSARGQRVDYLAFTSENRFAAGLTQTDSGYQLCVNGAPEHLLEASTHVITKEGVQTVFGAEAHAHFYTAIDRLTREGMRVIAVASKEMRHTDIPEDVSSILSDLTFRGLLVFHDPVRTDVAEAIRSVQKAGAQVRLVTGDNPETALSIARSVGIVRPEDVALVGKDIAQFSDSELYDVLKTTHVFARVLPRQKLRLAQVLQKRGEIVAMTGDGINDAPALQKANIGVALGSGTEVAKEASDLVLVKDTFATISSAIEEGRRIINNLRKITGYLLSTSLSEAVLIGGALLASAPVPIVPVQILWANIIEEGLMSVAFAFEPGEKNAMQRRPYDIYEEGILSKEMLKFIGMTVAILSTMLIALYVYLLYIDLPLEELRSVMFLLIAVDSLFIAFSFRSLTTPIWKIPLLTNTFFAISFAISTGLLLLVLSVPFMQYLLSYQPLELWEIALIVGYGFISLITIEVGKWLFFERKT